MTYDYRVAFEHPSAEARAEYLREHPKADPSRHTVLSPRTTPNKKKWVEDHQKEEKQELTELLRKGLSPQRIAERLSISKEEAENLIKDHFKDKSVK